MKPECRFCFLLNEGSASWTKGYYRCSSGHFDKKFLQFYSWSGIWRPNKTVLAAQTGCQDFEKHPRIREIKATRLPVKV